MALLIRHFSCTDPFTEKWKEIGTASPPPPRLRWTGRREFTRIFWIGVRAPRPLVLAPSPKQDWCTLVGKSETRSAAFPIAPEPELPIVNSTGLTSRVHKDVKKKPTRFRC